MRNAFITTNPLLPDEYFVPKGLDRLVLEMNEPVKYSLLDCPGKYTVKIATFTGRRGDRSKADRGNRKEKQALRQPIGRRCRESPSADDGAAAKRIRSL